MTAATVIRPRRRVFPGANSQVGRARLFVGDVLDGCPAADDAVLLTSELVTNAIAFFLLCYRVAIAAIGGKRTCGLCCSTTSSSLPLVTEPRETGQPPTGQGPLRHGYHQTRRVRREILHTASGSGGKVIVTVYRADTRVRIDVKDDGSDQAPVVHPVGEARESGFGLGLVDLMADRWGHCGGRRGRVVWFMLEWKTNS